MFGTVFIPYMESCSEVSGQNSCPGTYGSGQTHTVKPSLIPRPLIMYGTWTGLCLHGFGPQDSLSGTSPCLSMYHIAMHVIKWTTPPSLLCFCILQVITNWMVVKVWSWTTLAGKQTQTFPTLVWSGTKGNYNSILKWNLLNKISKFNVLLTLGPWLQLQCSMYAPRQEYTPSRLSFPLVLLTTEAVLKSSKQSDSCMVRSGGRKHSICPELKIHVYRDIMAQ